MSDPVLAEAALFIARYEGFVDHMYLCPAGVQSFGYGSVLANHPELKFPITTEQGKVYLAKDLGVCLGTLDEHIQAPLNMNQTVALLSFIYNVGSGNFIKSTMHKLLDLLQYSAAADQFLRWINCKGRALPGLVNRRKAERALFLTPYQVPIT